MHDNKFDNREFDKIARQALNINVPQDLSEKLWRNTLKHVAQQPAQEAPLTVKTLWRELIQVIPLGGVSLSFMFLLAVFAGTQLTLNFDGGTQASSYTQMLELLVGVS
ncbi:MAG: DUF3379 domain-containing protein [Alphaproteobacteria bacterium]|nr:DUF3379 domain-containing protein [Alphaproteobacteria bacterium]